MRWSVIRCSGSEKILHSDGDKAAGMQAHFQEIRTPGDCPSQELVRNLVLNLNGEVHGDGNDLVVERGWTEAEFADRCDNGCIELRVEGFDDLNIASVSVRIDVQLDHESGIGRQGCETRNFDVGRLQNLCGNNSSAN